MIARFEAILALDPARHWDWIELGRLYQVAGRWADAQIAAERSLTLAPDDRARAASLVGIGDVRRAQGDLAGARAAYEESLDLRRRLVAGDESSAQAQRDVAAVLSRLALLPDHPVDWADVAAQFERMEAAGQLAPADRPFLESARRRAAEEAAEQR